MPFAGRVLFAAAIAAAANCSPAHAATPTPWVETLLDSFTPTAGDTGSEKGYNPPLGVLVDGTTIYGSNYYGGNKGGGTIYKHVGTKTTVLYEFVDQTTLANSCGYNPSAVLIKSGSTIYGTTFAGGVGNGGVVFSLTPTPGKIKYTCTALFSFSNTGPAKQRGYGPFGGLLLIGSDLYGTTGSGGVDSGGVLYKLTLPGGKANYTILHNFATKGAALADGSAPAGRVITDGGGALYGMTYFGGVRNGGVIYKYTIGTSTYEALYKFPGRGNNDSNTPKGYQPTINGLVMDGSGILYGETTLGGNKLIFAAPAGVLFKFDPATLTYTVLHTFDSSNDPSDGYSPFGGLIFKGANSLIGAAQLGGDGGGGTIFEISKTGVYTKLIDFNGESTPGFKPGGPVAPFGADGFVGTTYNGGDQNGGVLYKITPPAP